MGVASESAPQGELPIGNTLKILLFDAWRLSSRLYLPSISIVRLGFCCTNMNNDAYT
jgi:hypothetical protein